MESTICAAPTCREVVSGHFHCKYHHSLLTPIYLKYKELQNKLPMLNNLDEADLPILLDYYRRYAKVYTLRQQYRHRGFRRELWDAGHQGMIESFWSQLLQLEKAISQKVVQSTELEESNEIVVEEEELSDEIETLVDVSAISKLHRRLELEELLTRSNNCFTRINETYRIETEKILGIISQQLLKGVIKIVGESESDMFTKGWSTVFNIKAATSTCFLLYLTLQDIICRDVKSTKSEISYDKSLPNCCLKILIKALCYSDLGEFLCYITLRFLSLINNDTMNKYKGIKRQSGFNLSIHPECKIPIFPFDNKDALWNQLNYKDYYVLRFRTMGKFNKFGLMKLFCHYLAVIPMDKLNWKFDLFHKHQSKPDSCQMCLQELRKGLNPGNLHTKEC